jgi:hypothetical protein
MRRHAVRRLLGVGAGPHHGDGVVGTQDPLGHAVDRVDTDVVIIVVHLVRTRAVRHGEPVPSNGTS